MEARCDHGSDLRLLRHWLWLDGPSGGWGGGEPDSGSALSGQSGHGLSQGLGGAGPPRIPRPGDSAPLAEPDLGCDGGGVLVPGARRIRLTDEVGAAEAWAPFHRVPEHRPDLHRGDGPAGGSLQIRNGWLALRFQYASVHGHGACRLQAELGLRRPALHVCRLRGVGLPGVRGFKPSGGSPHFVATRAAQPAESGDRGARSPKDRDGHGGHLACAAGSEVRPNPPLRTSRSFD